MERKEFANVNEFSITGPIVRKFMNNVASNVTIKIPRNNMPNITRQGDKAYNYPEVAFYSRSKEMCNDFKEGDVVTITGYVQSLKKTSKETGKDYYEQKFVGEKIVKAEKLLKKNFDIDDGEGYIPSICEVKLIGTISRMFVPASGILSINVRAYVGGHINNLQTFIYHRNAEKLTENLKVGDTICMVASIQTVKKEGKEASADSKFFANIVADSFCKLDALQ